MLKITQVKRYRARYKMHNGTARAAERASLTSVYRRVAWWLIVDKHGREPDRPDEAIWLPPGYDALLLPDELHGYFCECHTERGDSECSLHNREHGYYSRLHQRIARWLEAGYIVPEAA